MSQSPAGTAKDPQAAYLDSFNQLAMKIRDGQSFSGRERNCFFLNTGGLKFADGSAAAALDWPDDGRGMVLTDWDADGDLDVFLTNRGAPRVRILRNDSTGGHWLGIRLTGDPARRTPRDAIGARVTVHRTSGSVLTRTLSAGDGFLSQQSKTLHFGLGEDVRIERVTVRWPGGGEDSYNEITADGFWYLVQGGGAKAVSVPKAVLKDGEAQVPPASENLRLRLSQPLKLPALSFVSAAGSRDSVESLTNAGPVLINLWATWCAPCAAELRDFSQLSGVTVFPLCVDRLDGARKTTTEQAAAFLEKAGHKGAWGWADPELVAALDGLIREAVYRHHRMPVPASFLINRNGMLTVIYKGPVSRATLEADLAGLNMSAEDARKAAVPFAGEWAGRTVFVMNPVAVAEAWREAGYDAEAQKVLETWLSANASGNDPGLAAGRAKVLFALGDLALEAGNGAAAMDRFTAALATGASVPAARIGQLRALALLGRSNELNRLSGELLGTPLGPDALAARADLALRQGHVAEAAAALREAVAKNPRFVPGLNRLAWILATAPSDADRRGPEALQITEFFLQAPGAAENPEFILTKAAALMEAGRNQDAATAAGQARAVASNRADMKFLRRSRPVIEAILSGKPWRQPLLDGEAGAR